MTHRIDPQHADRRGRGNVPAAALSHRRRPTARPGDPLHTDTRPSDRAISRGPPSDAVVLDLLMPVVGGLTFLEHAARSPESAGIPVIVVSGAALELRTAAARHPSVRAVLAKPFTLWHLLALVRQATSAARN